MDPLTAINALSLATSTALELVTAVNKAAIAINARHQRGGDFTAEELAEVEGVLKLSKENRDKAIAEVPA